MRRPRSMIFSVARHRRAAHGEAPSRRCRAGAEASLSPQNTWIRSGGTPSRSLTIWTKAVSFPCPSTWSRRTANRAVGIDAQLGGIRVHGV